jgi:uncharacterized repeat protein (TIGR03803 family)
MKSRSTSHISLVATVIAAIIFSLAVHSQAQTEKILHNFSLGNFGAVPAGGLIFDSAGNLYGTTLAGGPLNYCNNQGCGLVYRLANVNGVWMEKVLRDFPSNIEGSSDLIFDAAGNLYGTTLTGGSTTTCADTGHTGCGTVYELTPTSSGQWTRKVLYAFPGGANGAAPYAKLIFDSAGNLYGTTGFGGSASGGTVFKLSPGFGGAWRETVLYNFTCQADGCDPQCPLAMDSAGNLYGTAYFSSPGFGVVFEVSPTTSGVWTEITLYTFQGGADGETPTAGLIFDSSGNLYGTTNFGGGTTGCNKVGCGTAFELSPNGDGTWTETILHSFVGGKDGNEPASMLVFDSAGNLYGTTFSGGSSNKGTAYELSPGSGGTWTEKILHSFTASTTDGGDPGAGALVLDSSGNLYGTTQIGGTSNLGVAYEITP